MPRPGTLRERLKKTVKPDQPLGPADASRIKDLEVAAKLFDPHNISFNTLMRKNLSVLTGRRGSGKTSLLKSYMYRDFLDRDEEITSNNPGFDFRRYEIVIEVPSHKKFEEMQKEAAKAGGVFRPIESVVDDWREIIQDFFLAKLLEHEYERASERHLEAVAAYLGQPSGELRDEVRRLVWGESLWKKIKSIFVQPGMIQDPDPFEHLTQEMAMEEVVEYLEESDQNAVLIFDSMDEYKTGAGEFDRTVGALIRFISEFNDLSERVKIKLALPAEIFPEVQDASANPLKDLVDFDQVQWKAMELAQIAAYRFRLFLELWDPKTAVTVSHYDLGKREQVRAFWNRFFRGPQVNRYNSEEDSMVYIMRHTQLLPRQLFLILKGVIVESHRDTGGYREFKKSIVISAIEKSELVIAAEILSAFKHVYPFAQKAGKAAFGNFPTVFTFNELEDKWRKSVRALFLYKPDFNMPDFAEMLIRMGIIGLVEEETERYFEATFGYSLLTPFNIGDGHSLCLHPIFSKYFKAAPNGWGKPVLPMGVAT